MRHPPGLGVTNAPPRPVQHAFVHPSRAASVSGRTLESHATLGEERAELRVEHAASGAALPRTESAAGIDLDDEGPAVRKTDVERKLAYRRKDMADLLGNIE